jgi:glycosyltransferase involved in cell wall biosynthesis
MKILLVSPTQGHYGGMETSYIVLAAAVAQWPEFEVRVCFKLVQGFPLRDDLRSATAGLTCPVYFLPSGDPQLLKLIRWADLVHGHNTSPDVIFPARWFRKKLVLTIHNWRNRKLSFHSLLWGLGARLAHRRWYNSHFVWDTWEPRGRSRSSACVHPVGLLPQNICPPADRKGFLFLARWIENKGLEELVTAYARANLDTPEWPLTLLGDGPLKPKIQALIRQFSLRNVIIPGFVDYETKAKYFAAARWNVAPPHTREDLGLTPIEARSVGVPSIVTRDGGLPEAAGDAALVVEPGNIAELTAALQRAAAMSEAEYLERAERSRATLKEFLLPMDFYRTAYTELLAADAGRKPQLAPTA